MTFHQQVIELCKAILLFEYDVAPLKEQLFNLPILTKQLVWNHIVGATFSKVTPPQIYSFFAKHGLTFQQGDTQLLIWQYSSSKDDSLKINDLWQLFKPLTMNFLDQIMVVRQRKISLPKCYEAHYRISDLLSSIMKKTIVFLRKIQQMKWNIVKAHPQPFQVEPLDAPHLQIYINKKEPFMLLKEVEIVFKHILRNQTTCLKNFQQYFIPFNYKSKLLNPNFLRQQELVDELQGIQLIKYHAENVDFIKNKQIKKTLYLSTNKDKFINTQKTSASINK